MLQGEDELRMRLSCNAFLVRCGRPIMVEVLKPCHSLVSEALYCEVAKQWACGDPDATAIIEKVFATAGITMDTVHAKKLALHIDEVERIDRMTMVAEGRRDSILREIDQQRTLTRRRRAIHDFDALSGKNKPATDFLRNEAKG